jgi:transcriptional regulator with XRE-family HTH domain
MKSAKAHEPAWRKRRPTKSGKQTHPNGVSPLPYGRGTGIPNPIDVHVGGRIRARRLFIGMKQEALANALGLTFQQVQKYEKGANRVSASRLSAMATTLDVPISYFFAEMSGQSPEPEHAARRDQLSDPHTIELARCYWTITDDKVRASFFAMVKAAAEMSKPAKAG